MLSEVEVQQRRDENQNYRELLDKLARIGEFWDRVYQRRLHRQGTPKEDRRWLARHTGRLQSLARMITAEGLVDRLESAAASARTSTLSLALSLVFQSVTIPPDLIAEYIRRRHDQDDVNPMPGWWLEFNRDFPTSLFLESKASSADVADRDIDGESVGCNATRSILWSRHFDRDGNSINDSMPLSLKEISLALKTMGVKAGVDEGSVSRNLTKIAGGMSNYKKLLMSPEGRGRLRSLLDPDAFARAFGVTDLGDLRASFDNARDASFLSDNV